MKKDFPYFPLLVTLVCFAAASYFYPLLPEKVASHWNAAGEVDGHMSRFWGAFLAPVIMTGMLMMFWLIPRIDPRRRNIQEFFGAFKTFIALVFLFFAYVYALTLWWNLGGQFNLAKFLVPALAGLFYAAGDLVAQAKPNWFVGIRTPWTLENENVWNKTHALGGKLYKLCGLLALLALFWPGRAFVLVVVLIVGVSLFLMVYSYVEYTRQKPVIKE